MTRIEASFYDKKLKQRMSAPGFYNPINNSIIVSTADSRFPVTPGLPHSLGDIPDGLSIIVIDEKNETIRTMLLNLGWKLMGKEESRAEPKGNPKQSGGQKRT